jgi:predicted DNA-binding transcriptional regulator YafY
MRRLERLVAIALFLGARRRVLARDVAARFEISLRTVYRDIRALADAGFPVEGNAGDGYRVPQESYLRPLALTAEEAEVLTIAAHALGASVTAPMRDALTRATTKLEASLDRATRRRVHELDDRIVVPELARRTAAPTVEIIAALREHQVARITYADPQNAQRTTRDVEPLGLVCRGDAWWLVAYCRLRADARAFRVDRIAAWHTTGARYAPRDGFSFAEIVARDRHLTERLFGY